MDKKIIGEIESYEQKVDFEMFLSQFKDEEEISTFEIHDLLNVDYEKLGELKEKTTDLIDICSKLPNDETGKSQLMLYFCEKLNVKFKIKNILFQKDLKRNETNVQLLVNNVDKIDNLIFSQDKIQVCFKK